MLIKIQMPASGGYSAFRTSVLRHRTMFLWLSFDPWSVAATRSPVLLRTPGKSRTAPRSSGQREGGQPALGCAGGGACLRTCVLVLWFISGASLLLSRCRWSLGLDGCHGYCRRAELAMCRVQAGTQKGQQNSDGHEPISPTK